APGTPPEGGPRTGARPALEGAGRAPRSALLLSPIHSDLSEVIPYGSVDSAGFDHRPAARPHRAPAREAVQRPRPLPGRRRRRARSPAAAAALAPCPRCVPGTGLAAVRARGARTTPTPYRTASGPGGRRVRVSLARSPAPFPTRPGGGKAALQAAPRAGRAPGRAGGVGLRGAVRRHGHRRAPARAARVAGQPTGGDLPMKVTGGCALPPCPSRKR